MLIVKVNRDHEPCIACLVARQCVRAPAPVREDHWMVDNEHAPAPDVTFHIACFTDHHTKRGGVRNI